MKNRQYNHLVTFFGNKQRLFIHQNIVKKQRFFRGSLSLSNLHQVILEKIKVLQVFFVKSVYILNLQVTLNNIYITITLSNGKVVFVGSGGSLKIRNSKRNTTYILQLLLILLFKKIRRKNKVFILKIYNLKKKYRKVLLKYCQMYYIRILYIQNVLQRAYNGVRLEKKRRI
jgi:ribosomal protein S11